MAIKGKNRSRSRARSTGAPKPRVEPKKQPLRKRKGFRIGALVAFALLSIWIGTTVWGNVSRAHALRVYDEQLFAATRSYLMHTQPGGELYVQDIHRRFQEGQLTVEGLREAVKTWETDFDASLQAVRALEPPRELADANELIADGIDGYKGVARLYELAAQQKELIGATRDRTVRTAVEDQLQLLLIQIDDARARAERAVAAGQASIRTLKLAWGVESEQAPPPVGG